MAANVLNSKMAVQASVQVVRAFIRLRQMLVSNEELASKLGDLEHKYDAQFRVVFDAIRQLMTSPRTTSQADWVRKDDEELVEMNEQAHDTGYKNSCIRQSSAIKTG